MNQRGFATITLLALLPLLMTIIAVSMGLWFLIKSDVQARHRCRVELLTSQNEVVQTLESLLALNAPAKALRLQKKLLEAMRDVGSPAQRLQADALIQLLERKQRILDRQQRALIARGVSLSTQRPWATIEKIKDGFAAHSRVIDLSSARVMAAASVGKFDLVATPLGEPAPEYHPSHNFEKRQIVGARWKAPVSSLAPRWTHPFLASSRDLSLQGQCSVSIRQNQLSIAASRGGKKWQVHLEADK